MNKVLSIDDFVASIPIGEIEAFEGRCMKYSQKMGLDHKSSEVKEAVAREMYSKEFAAYEAQQANS